MTWTKLSDDFCDDCWTLSDRAFRLHVEGLAWSNRKLLDLRIPKADVRRFASHPDSVVELLAVNYWADAGSHYLIRHHAQYQRSREAVVSQQEANAANGRASGRKPRPPREQASNLSEAVKPPDASSDEPILDSLSDSFDERDGPGRALDGVVGLAASEAFGFANTEPDGLGEAKILELRSAWKGVKHE